MADQFARAAGFAGDETTEASMMPPPRRLPDMTVDDSQATGMVPPPLPQQARAQRLPSQVLPPSGERVVSRGAVENRGAGSAVVANGKTGSIRVPASRVPLQPSNSQTGSSSAGSRPNSALAVAGRSSLPSKGVSDDFPLQDEEEEEDGDSSDELFDRPNPNMTAANETTVASVDNSEWHRHKKEHQATAGIGMKNLQSRIGELTQEREDLKIEVDVLRSAYRPDENMSELIRVRQELVKSKKYSQTLKLLGEQQSIAIRQLKKEANALKKQQAGGGDSTLRTKLAEMEDAVRLLDQQREEEVAARRAAEEEAQRRKEDFEKLEQEHNAHLVSD